MVSMSIIVVALLFLHQSNIVVLAKDDDDNDATGNFFFGSLFCGGAGPSCGFLGWGSTLSTGEDDSSCREYCSFFPFLDLLFGSAECGLCTSSFSTPGPAPGPTEATRAPIPIGSTSSPTGQPAPAPSPTPEVEIAVDLDLIRRSASLVEGVDPTISSLLQEIENNPEDEERNNELRDKVQQAWASSEGRDLAETFENSNDPTYLELKEALRPTLAYLCTEIVENSQFSQSVKDCICKLDATPTVFCAARIDQEIKDAVAGDAGNQRRDQSSKCELDVPGNDKNDSKVQQATDVFAIFQNIVGGEPFCVGLECSVPFPPPLSFLAFKGKAGGCLKTE